MPETLFDKLWRAHEICQLSDQQSLIYVDRIVLHERTGSIALASLAARGRAVRQRRHAFCTMDHIIDTTPGRNDNTRMPGGRDFIIATRTAAQEMDITLFDINDPDQGIVHVISPELGIAQPGATLVCPDSHTCSLGGLGALAWGVGSTEATHALATSPLRVRRPGNHRIEFVGDLPAAATAKDMILFVIRELSAAGGAGQALEFAGAAVRQLSVEGRLTLCNMATELAAFTAVIAPDQTVFDYLKGRPYAPTAAYWQAAETHWRTFFSDPTARFDHETTLSISHLKPQLSWGTSPQHSMDWDATIPDPEQAGDAVTRDAWRQAQRYMHLQPRSRLSDYRIDAAFIGSCTNSRLSDLRMAGDYLRRSGFRVAPGVKALCVPGSGRVKRAAEAEGLDEVFRSAGFEWREPGCSLCFYAGGEHFDEGARVVSTTNRNFEGRQGLQVRTHLASPLSVVASACAGYLTAAGPH